MELGVTYIKKNLKTKGKGFRMAIELSLDPHYKNLREWNLEDNLGFVVTESTISIQRTRKYYQAYQQFGIIRT